MMLNIMRGEVENVRERLTEQKVFESCFYNIIYNIIIIVWLFYFNYVTPYPKI